MSSRCYTSDFLLCRKHQCSGVTYVREQAATSGCADCCAQKRVQGSDGVSLAFGVKVCVCLCSCVWLCMVLLHVCVCVHVCVSMCVWVCDFSVCVCVCMCVCVCVCTHVCFSKRVFAEFSWAMCLFVHALMSECISERAQRSDEISMAVVLCVCVCISITALAYVCRCVTMHTVLTSYLSLQLSAWSPGGQHGVTALLQLLPTDPGWRSAQRSSGPWFHRYCMWTFNHETFSTKSCWCLQAHHHQRSLKLNISPSQKRMNARVLKC